MLPVFRHESPIPEISRVPIHQKQADFLRLTTPYQAFCGGRGVGKSIVGAYKSLIRAKPFCTYGIYAPSYKMLRRATLKSFISIARPWIIDMSLSDGIIVLRNGAEFICCSVDDPESARGPNLSGAWVDEASLCKKEAFDIIIACLREYGVQGELFATFTPKGKRHWTYKTFVEGSHSALIHARTEENPFLPELFAETVRSQYTLQFASQELDANFVDIEGALCKASWFEVVPAAPANLETARGWDLAATEKKSADFTAGIKIGRDSNGIFYVMGMVHGQYPAGEVERVMKNTASQDGGDCIIGIEQEGGASGKIAMKSLISNLAGYDVKAMPTTGDKATRIMPFLAQAEAGNVKIVKGDWNDTWLDEMCGFPEAEHDDIVDGTAHAFNRLAKPEAALIFA